MFDMFHNIYTLWRREERGEEKASPGNSLGKEAMPLPVRLPKSAQEVPGAMLLLPPSHVGAPRAMSKQPESPPLPLSFHLQEDIGEKAVQ